MPVTGVGIGRRFIGHGHGEAAAANGLHQQQSLGLREFPNADINFIAESVSDVRRLPLVAKVEQTPLRQRDCGRSNRTDGKLSLGQ